LTCSGFFEPLSLGGRLGFDPLGFFGPLDSPVSAYGEEGVRFYTRQKVVMRRWPATIGKGAEFAMPVSK
jgi:hypothetical protein